MHHRIIRFGAVGGAEAVANQQAFGAGTHGDGVAVFHIAAQQEFRQGVLQGALDDTFQRARAKEAMEMPDLVVKDAATVETVNEAAANIKWPIDVVYRDGWFGTIIGFGVDAKFLKTVRAFEPVYCADGGTAKDRTNEITIRYPHRSNQIGIVESTYSLGDTYVDQGATATDNADGNITSKIVVDNKVNTSKIGLYTVSYNVTDSSGNKADEVIRQVDVQGDKTPPVITLLGDNPFEMDVYTSFVDPGATAIDNIDGDVTSLIAVAVKVDTFRVGSYKVYYTAYDNSGNASVTAERDVEVLDREAPVITLRGSANITLTQNKDVYKEDSADITDNYYDDTDLIISGTVDESTVGTYYVYYDATDRSGNTATQVVRTIVVEKDISIHEIDGLDELELYPNPTKDLLNVKLTVSKDLDGELRIIDVLGHEMFVQNINVIEQGQFTIPVESLSGGMYYLEIVSDERSTTRSFSIVR